MGRKAPNKRSSGAPAARRSVGLPPGEPVYVGQPRSEGVSLWAIVYDAGAVVEHQHPSPTEIRALVQEKRVVWLDCDGVHDPNVVTEICTAFEVHPLAVEDILDTRSRPKMDVYENRQLVLAVNMITAVGAECEIVSEHVTLVIGPNFVLSFQEGRAGDLFDPVRNRIRNGVGRIRSLSADYLLHALVDTIIDESFVVVERLEEQIDLVERDAFLQRNPELPARVYELKASLATIRRSIFPLREPISRLLRGETDAVSRAVEPYLRDLHDHIIQVLEVAEAGSDRLTSVLEVYLAAATHRMNDVMKVLTIVATIFIPLSWVAGIYGMNFDHMPELHWVYGYPLAIGTMVAMGLGMLWWFRRSGWL